MTKLEQEQFEKQVYENQESLLKIMQENIELKKKGKIIKEENFKDYIIEKEVVEKYVNHVDYYLPREQYTLQDMMNITMLLRDQVVSLLGQLYDEKKGEDY